MSESLTPGEFIVLLSDTFERGQLFTFVPSGNSMKPMLDGKRDKVTFSPKPEKLNKYDVALYLRPKSGQLVLHRMIGFDKNGGYVFSGDNQYTYEYGITDDDILAVLSYFTRNRKEICPDSPGYKAYIRSMMVKKRLMSSAAYIYHKVKK